MSEKKFEVYDLKVNQITEALGMDVEKPVFSWKLELKNRILCRNRHRFWMKKQPAVQGSGTAV